MNFIINNPLFQKNIGLSTHISSDEDTYLHKHNYYEIFYIINGSIEHQCNNIKKELSVGELFILRPNDLHQFIRKNEPCSHRDIMISIELFEKVCSYLSPNFFEKLNMEKFFFSTTISIEKVQQYEMLFKDFNIKINENGFPSADIAKCIFSSFFSDFLLNLSSSKELEIPMITQKIISILNSVDGIKYGISAVVKRYSYSPVYLSRIFKESLGITMTDYLKNIRLNYAELYLQTTNLSLEQISEEVGILSVSYLIKIFKKKHGISPNKYRMRFKHEQKKLMPNNFTPN